MIERKNKLPKAVKKYCEEHSVINLKFASYLERYKNGEILERIFAFKKLTNKPLQIFEVMRRVSNGKVYYCRDLWFYPIAGYKTYFDEKEEWCEIKDSMKCEVNLFSRCINPELLLKTNKYRYCAYNCQTNNVVDYLNLYSKYPGLEFMSKLGVKPSIALLKKAEKDKKFCKFLYKNKNEVSFYAPKVILYAYNHGLGFYYCLKYFNILLHFRYFSFSYFYNSKKEEFIKYCINNDIGLASYEDYYRACIYLKLNMSESKNAFPKDFMRMHDLRIDEYHSLKEKEELASKRKFYKKFREVSNKYSFLNISKDYCVFVAPSVQSLVREGKLLNHCVGVMGYDEKMCEEKSLILFIRKLDNVNKPFVTMEYSLKSGKILQIYGYHDSTPDKDVIDFSKRWLKFANNKINKLKKKVA